MNRSFAQLARHTLDGTILVFLSEALILPTGLIITAFLTRRLGSSEYGLLTLSATLVAWIEWSIASLFSRATIKFVGQVEDWRSVGATSTKLQLLASSGAAIMLALLARPIAGLFGEPELVTYLRLFALDIPLFSLAVLHKNLLTGLGDFRQKAATGASRYIARMLLIVLLVGIGLSVTGAILGMIGASIVELLVSRIYIRPSLFHRSSFPTRQLWDFALPLFLFSLSMRFYDKLDLFALKALGGSAAQAGIYGAAQNLSLLPGIFALSFSPLLLSTLSRMINAGQKSDAIELSRWAMRLVIMMFPFAGMTAGASSEIVNFIFGRDFSTASQLLEILIFGALATSMISVTTVILTAADKPTWTFALTGPLLPLATAGHIILIPRLGAIGATLVSTSFSILGALLTVAAVYRIWRVLPPLATVVRSLLICFLAFVLAASWHTSGLLLLLKLPVIGLFIVSAFILFGEFSISEIALIRSLVRRESAGKIETEKFQEI